MAMLGLSVIFLGYTLCYASVANHGKFAVAPWNGVFGDAYDAA